MPPAPARTATSSHEFVASQCETLSRAALSPSGRTIITTAGISTKSSRQIAQISTARSRLSVESPESAIALMAATYDGDTR